MALLIECLNCDNAHGALFNIAWPRIVYAENEAGDENVRLCGRGMSICDHLIIP